MGAKLTAVFNRAREIAYRALKAHPPQVWLVLALPVFLTTALIVSVGPYLQAHTLPLPESSAPTIYESIYPNVVARFPSISSWLLQALSPVPILIGLVATVWATNASTAHAFALRLGTTVAVIYTVADLFGGAILQIKGYPSFLANVTANVAGGVIVSIVGYLLVAILRSVQSALGRSRTTHLVTASSIVGTGLVLSIATYVGIVSFYKPLSADVEVTASLPLAGAIAPPEPAEPNPTREGHADDETNDITSRLTPSKLEAGVFSTRGVDKAGRVAWRTPSDGPIYTLRVFIDTGCFPLTDVPRASQPVMTVPNVSQFALHNGATELIAYSETPFEVSSLLPSVTQFWLPKPADAGAESVQYFLSEGDKFTLKGRNTVNVAGTWILFRAAGNQARPTSKTMAFAVNGTSYTVSASSNRAFGKGDPFSCRSLSPRDPRLDALQSTRHVVLTTDQPMVGMRFEIAESGQPAEGFSVSPFELSFSGINGWSDIRKISAKPGQYVGEVGSVLLDPGTGSFLVYGREVAKDWNSAMLVGKFTIYRPDPNTLRFSGTAHAVTRNETRLNKTRWELLSDSIKVWLIAGFFAVSAAMLAWCFRTLNGHLMTDPKTWV